MSGARTVCGILGLVLLFLGTIFILQGLNVSFAPQSYMTSDIRWTYRGVGFDLVGLALLVWALRTPGGWKNVLGGLGALLAIFGVLWVLQGLNVLPGMGMSGHMEWARNGGIAFVIGAVLIFIAGRGKSAA